MIVSSRAHVIIGAEGEGKAEVEDCGDCCDGVRAGIKGGRRGNCFGKCSAFIICSVQAVPTKKR